MNSELSKGAFVHINIQSWWILSCHQRVKHKDTRERVRERRAVAHLRTARKGHTRSQTLAATCLAPSKGRNVCFVNEVDFYKRTSLRFNTYGLSLYSGDGRICVRRGGRCCGSLCFLQINSFSLVIKMELSETGNYKRGADLCEDPTRQRRSTRVSWTEDQLRFGVQTGLYLKHLYTYGEDRECTRFSLFTCV